MGKTRGCSDLNLNDASSLFFWGLILLLFVLVVGNFILTLMIISFFKIGMGMEAIKLIPEEKAINFYGVTEFNKIYKKDGLIEGFRDSPMSIESSDEFIKFNLMDRKGHNINKFIMGTNGTDLKHVNHFTITDPDTKLPIFASSKLTYNLEKTTRRLESSVIHAPEVVSVSDEKLKLSSDRKVIFRGIEGTTVEGEKLTLTAEENVSLHSTNGLILLEAGSFVLDGPQNVSDRSIYGSNLTNLQFKLCACKTNDLRVVLYRVQLSSSNIVNPCLYFDPNYHPCGHH